MVTKAYFKKSYFDLTEHNSLQISLFMLIALLSASGAFFLTLPLFENFFTDFLTGQVVHDGGFCHTRSRLLSLRGEHHTFSPGQWIFTKIPPRNPAIGSIP